MAVPKPLKLKTPVGFVLPDNQRAYASSIDDWLELLIRNDTVERIYRHWILGEATLNKAPRWNIKDDVLGWGKKDTPTLNP